MDSKRAASILERVKREREKRAEAGAPPAPGASPAVQGGIPLAALAAGLLAHGTMTGATYGGIAGAGYGSAKKRPFAGAGRGVVRGGLTGLGATGGAMAGATAGGLAGQGLASGAGPLGQAGASGLGMLLGGLAGGVGGGVLGWKGANKLIGDDLEEKKGGFADPSAEAFSGALQDMAAGQLKSDAFKDVRNIGLASLGVGAAGRGLVGLIQMMRAGKPKKTRSGPAYLPLPYPAEAKMAAEKRADLAGDIGVGAGAGAGMGAGLVAGGAITDRKFMQPGKSKLGNVLKFLANMGTLGTGLSVGGTAGASGMSALLGRNKQAGFLDGDMASTKGGIPWYGPAMLLGGLGGLGLGWKGMDKVLDARRQKEQEGELVKAREQFHDALLSQYEAPIKTHPSLMKKKAGDESTMEKVGKALDALYDKFEAAKEQEEKVAVDWENLAGQATGGYGMYAGLSGLLTGALVYDKINKRSRRAILEKALQQRQRRKYMQQPTEIMAVPEPMPAAA